MCEHCFWWSRRQNTLTVYISFLGFTFCLQLSASNYKQKGELRGSHQTQKPRVDMSDWCMDCILTGRNITVEEFISLHTTVDISVGSEFSCSVCNRKFCNIAGLRAHENRCKRKHGIPVLAKVGRDELDITEEELTIYIHNQTRCEICGKSVLESVKYKGTEAAKRLCVDHDHNTNKFRGMLCRVCNRQLGWFEKNKEAIEKYLEKTY